MLIAIVAFIIALTLLLLYLFPIVVVCGDSMLPTYHDGDIMVGSRLPILFKSPLKVEDVYVYMPPSYEAEQRFVIKRLVFINDEGKRFFEGDNPPQSYDSRMYGYINRSRVVAHCLFTIKKRKEKS